MVEECGGMCVCLRVDGVDTDNGIAIKVGVKRGALEVGSRTSESRDFYSF